MKHYLELVSLSAKAHARRDRMSVFCIVLAVFLVTAIFGMADLFVRSQIAQAQKEYGSWHISLRDIGWEDAALAAARPDVAALSPYGVLNYRGSADYTLGGKGTAICGGDPAQMPLLFPDQLVEGRYPQAADEALVTDNAKAALGLEVGSAVTLQLPEGESRAFTVSGFLDASAMLTAQDYYGVFLDIDAFCALYPAPAGGEPADYDVLFYLQFARTGDLRRSIADLKAGLGLADGQVAENTKLLGLLGQSSDSFMMQIYAAAAILVVLVLAAGVLMIASSLNSNVAQRTAFFGLLRCIGATPRQVMRLVRRESLHWCRFAIPIGVCGGIGVTWVLCGVLRYLSPDYFGAMPLFAVSLPSILSGAAVGLLTVFLAARAPARRASQVSPLTAVSGNAAALPPARRAAGAGRLPIEVSLGLHHAGASRKNLLLVTGSFALSIVLFLSFSVTVEFMQHALTPLRPWTADLSVLSPDGACTVPWALLDALQDDPAVDAVFGRQFAADLPFAADGLSGTADLISYEERQLGWAADSLQEGTLDGFLTEEGAALLASGGGTGLQPGSRVTVTCGGQSRQLRIIGLLSECPFDNTGGPVLLCSEPTFRSLTGQDGYAVLDIQLTGAAKERDVDAIRQLAGGGCIFSDKRASNRSTRGLYYSFGLFVYGFLVLIALITVCNVVNNIAMSVSARQAQYGAFRAIGLTGRQLARMVVAEAAAYALLGCLTGTAAGLLCNRLLFGYLILSRWGTPWALPARELAIILLIFLLSVALAVRGPLQRLRALSVSDTLRAL